MFLLALLLELVNVGEGMGVSDLVAVDCGIDSHSGSAEMNPCLGLGDGEEGDLSNTRGFSLLLNSSVAVRTKHEKCGEEGVFVILLMCVSLFIVIVFSTKKPEFK